ncbi:MAG TPA: tetratricopeptide repeat protein [Flavobacterium sp.]|nr:tetratricopeptide repeat protein [Flavobacterium sp.]
MATYNKRGYKTPKEKEDNNFIENVNVDEKDSTTAGVFNSLDQTASKTEAWVEKNQKAIFGFVGAVAFVVVGYVLYQKFITAPKEDEAANEMFEAQQNFQKAVDGTASDSLFTLALKGSEGKFGFVDIANKYSGTDAGNLANYYAGISYLNLKKYPEAIASLEKFKSDDQILSVLAHGAVGDAYAQQNKLKEALEHYIKASEMNKNEFTTPRFLLKAGQTALALGNKADAIKYFTEIKEKYEAAPEAQQTDALIGLAQ